MPQVPSSGSGLSPASASPLANAGSSFQSGLVSGHGGDWGWAQGFRHPGSKHCSRLRLSSRWLLPRLGGSVRPQHQEGLGGRGLGIRRGYRVGMVLARLGRVGAHR